MFSHYLETIADASPFPMGISYGVSANQRHYHNTNCTTYSDIFKGRTLVHEWGHLRWRLRDEYPVAGEERFYRDSNGGVEAVKCGKHMKGHAVDDVTGGTCTVNSTTGLPTSSCRYVADQTPVVVASLMFYHNLTEVTFKSPCAYRIYY